MPYVCKRHFWGGCGKLVCVRDKIGCEINKLRLAPHFTTYPKCLFAFGSCIEQPDGVNITLRPSSHSWSTNNKFKVNFGIKKVFDKDKFGIETWSI